MSDFEQRAMQYSQHAIIGLGVSVAKDVGIFDVLVESEEPLTSVQVAQSKGLRERYVRELLGCLATAQLIDATQNRDGVLLYSMDAEAKKAMKGKVGAFIKFPSAMAQRFTEIRDCVSANGPSGVRYSDYIQDMLDLFAQNSVPDVTANFLIHVPDLKQKLEQGISAIEFGSGRGRLSANLATQFPNSRFVASEYSDRLVEVNRQRWQHIPNLAFSNDDLCAIPDPPEQQFDWIFCHDVIHDLPQPFEALQGIRRLLKPDGVFTFVDITTSGSPITDRGDMGVALYYAAGTFLCIPESYQREESMALGPCWGKAAAVKLAQDAGFIVSVVVFEELSAMYVCTIPQN